MSNRENFSQNTIDKLAKRVSYKCSYPGCDNITVGPSMEKEDSTSSTGMACHIYAAAKGKGARRISEDSSIDLSGYNNGIWMCYKHGKKIDTDEKKYTPELLLEWKRVRESISETEHSFSGNSYRNIINNIKIAKNSIELNSDSFQSEISDFMDLTYARKIWGDDIFFSIREFITEVVRNSFSHGGANKVEIISNGSISIIEDGKEFDIFSLSTNCSGRGGHMSVKNLLDTYEGNVLISSSRENSKNIISVFVVNNLENIKEYTNCYLDFDERDILCSDKKLISVINESSIYDGCGCIYIISNYGMTYTCVEPLKNQIMEIKSSEVHASKKIFLVYNGMSKNLKEYMEENIPDVKFIKTDRIKKY